MRRVEFPCTDCQQDTLGEAYMVTDSLWAASGLAPNGGKLCVGCLEQRIGRQLAPPDFKDVPLNTAANRTRSERLKSRLGHTHQPALPGL